MSKGRLIFGFLIIALGAVLLLKNNHIVDVSIGTLILTYWPVLIAAWGLGFLIERAGTGGKICGGILLLLGIGLLGRNLGWFSFDFRLVWKLFWPLVIILAGISILTRSGSSRNNLAIMGGVEKNGIWQLGNAAYWTLMGGIHLDLRKAVIPDRKTTLTIFAVIGGIEVIVPPDLALVCEGTSLLGGVEFLGKNNGGILANLRAEQGEVNSAQKVVRLDCFAVMGGVEVKVLKE